MFVNVQGAKIHYSDAGHGVPTLFLHGIPDSGTVWEDVTRVVSASYRCIVPDLPGFGQSAVPAGFQVTLEGMAEFIDAFLGAVGISEPVNLVVHDIGGPFGLAWAVRHPEKVSSVTIMNTVFQSEYRWHRYGRICRMPILGELLHLFMPQSGLARSMHANSGAIKPSREHISATYRGFSGSVRKMVLRVYRGLDPEIFQTWDAQLRALAANVPSLVMWGDRDTYIDSRYAERFGAQKVKHFPQCGHWPMVEIPDVISRNLLKHFSEAACEFQAVTANRLASSPC
ncbi:alpha/beta hydrolase [Janthinobacterium sp. 17J80-10]|uniref:alpha/beta fold hydrolase n=1 Tax=Janthinobacterium sp. 17J80-10 TaxID=2497863 RepID=UPI001005A537|nr:alpha/beta hydrolase [Janthinobacterium sp. 17J80-10]QAU33038.1 alpha/beta hydrolase [Janthinobacterium sp. 17J80-10]